MAAEIVKVLIIALSIAILFGVSVQRARAFSQAKRPRPKADDPKNTSE